MRRKLRMAPDREATIQAYLIDLATFDVDVLPTDRRVDEYAHVVRAFAPLPWPNLLRDC